MIGNVATAVSISEARARQIFPLLATVSATPGADKIVKGDGTGKIAAGWLPDLSGTYALVSHTHDASAVVSGTLDTARIPSLSGTYALVSHTHDASAVVSGTLDTARIPSLSGTYALAGHSHDASAIVSGTLDTARIPSLSGTYALVSHIHTGKQVVGGFPNAVVSAGAGRNLSLYANSYINGTANEANARATLPYACTAKRLYVHITSTNAAGGSLTCTLFVNGSATALVVTVSAGAAAGTYSDTSHSVSISAGDGVCWQLFNNDGSNASGNVASVTMELDTTI